jgi:hypothetical protein
MVLFWRNISIASEHSLDLAGNQTGATGHNTAFLAILAFQKTGK